MKKIFYSILLIVSVLFLVACSNKKTAQDIDPLNDIILAENHPKFFDGEKESLDFVSAFPEDMVYMDFVGGEQYGEISDNTMFEIQGFQHNNQTSLIYFKIKNNNIKDVLKIAESYLPDKDIMKNYREPEYLKYSDEDGIMEYLAAYKTTDEYSKLLSEDDTLLYRSDIYIFLEPVGEYTKVKITRNFPNYYNYLTLNEITEEKWDLNK